ncbi:putative fused ATPase and permease component of metabolite ABC transporter [[Clostridium] ultunense Esp]|uniref:ABC transporter ATP-binding protein n=1 Tax=Thermicanus aegyptius TaxID=94009 RepID=UPI0002B6FD23|nr:ABC transporter transmembrane domain-containing protein [Thermicanus aegyptius]CCQ97040.1 putative fused ATPase and permease component of metabolite ABC transporter [[Clostridium] ultunense Esp]
MDEQFEVLERVTRQRVVRRLFRYLLPFWKHLALAFLLLTLATGADVAGPILVKNFIDGYLTPRNLVVSAILLLAAGYFVLLVAATVFHYFQYLYFNKIALWVIQRIRVDLFAKVQRLGLSFFDRTPGGSLVSRITNDTEAIKELYVNVLSTFVQNIFFILGVFVAMFTLDARLAALLLLVIPVILALMKTYRHFSSKIFHIARSKLSQLNARLNESLQGMTIIQAMRQEKRMQQEYEAISRGYFFAFLKQIKINGLLVRPAVDFIYLITLIFILGFFGIKSFSNPIEIGVLYAFVNYLDRMFEPINEMMFRLTSFQKAVVAAERVFGLMDETRLAPSQEGEKNPQIEEGLVEFKNVSFSYDGKTEVLKNISFVAKPGQTVALVGHTGSGKSSIINLLMRFYPVEKGEILIDGVPLPAYSDAELRKKVGLVLQDPFLFVGDVKYNIRLHNKEISDEEIVEASRFVQADAFIERLPGKYDEPVVERGATFSSGQRQLIAFARTMALKPKILVLDEATASVDTETEEAIQVALGRMRQGRTTIAIAHRLSTIQDADLILVLHHGEIVERGTHQELLAKRGLYYTMFLLQQGGLLSGERRERIEMNG